MQLENENARLRTELDQAREIALHAIREAERADSRSYRRRPRPAEAGDCGVRPTAQHLRPRLTASPPCAESPLRRVATRDGCGPAGRRGPAITRDGGAGGSDE